MNRVKRFFLSALMLMNLAVATAAVPAFPTAEGYGRWATGGRGGQVVEVTNLNDSGEGSLRWALSQYSNQPITVVFRVSGIIHLESDLRCGRTAGTTIAGQTAPGDGICIRGAKANFGGCENLIMRHLRFRIGLDENDDFIKGGSIGIENAKNFIIDHCTFGWSGEENMTIYDNDLTTIQWCIVHEGLYDAGHGKGPRGYGAQWGGQRATYHHNLLAHNKSRSPRLNGARSNDIHVLMEYVNNVNYNWGNQNSCYGGDLVEGKTHRVNFINNYYKPGPARKNSSYFVQSSFNGGQNKTQIAQWWMSGNVMEGNTSYTNNNFNGLDASQYTSKGIAKTQLMVDAPFEISDPVKAESAQDAYNSVLAGAGAFPRDAVDARIVNEVKTGTAPHRGSVAGVAPGIIDKPSDAGGYPTYNTYNQITDNDHDGMDDAWEAKYGLNASNAADRNLILKSGYTALEAYLCSLCGEDIPVEFAKPYDMVVAQDGSGDYTTIQAALDAAPDNGQRTRILVKNGTYEEKLFIGTRWTSSNKIISLIGEDVDKVIITWDDYLGKMIDYPGKDEQIKADGSTCGTFTINAPDFYMENITVKNPSTQAQAIALCQKGDRHVLKNCKILGNQDTHRTKKGRRYFYYNCEIEGGVDFIYAGGTCYFYQCNIVSNRGGYVTAPEDVPTFEKMSNGKNLYYGFFFNDCDLTAKAGVSAGSCYLGRPWGEKSGSVFMNCRLGSHINAAGWSKMGEETWKDCSFLEYKSLNADGTALADVSRRVSWSGQVSEDDRYYLMSLSNIYKKVNASNAFDPLPMAAAPQAPSGLKKSGNVLTWTAVPEAECYAIYADGRLLDYAATNSYCDIKSTGSPKYQVKAIGAYGNMSGFNGSAKTPTAQELDSILSPDYRVKLKLTISDEKAGTLTQSPMSPSYDKDALVTLSAEHHYGYRFVQWEDEQGNVLSTENPYQHKMERDITIKAVFKQLPVRKLSLASETDGNFAKYLPQGIVYADAQPQVVGESEGYEDGHELAVYVKDHPIFRFVSWEDGSRDVPRLIKMDADKSVKAVFKQEDFIAAWNFEQRQYDYYQPDMNPGDVVAEINLLDAEANYITWDRVTPGYFGAAAISNAGLAGSYFDLDAYVPKQGPIVVWSKVKAQGLNEGSVLLEYSLDGGTSYETLSTLPITSAQAGWQQISAALPQAAVDDEVFRVRWMLSSAAAAKTKAAAETKAATNAAAETPAETLLLSDVVLLKSAFTGLEQPETSFQVWMNNGMAFLGAKARHLELIDLSGRILLTRDHCDQVDLRMFPDGVYLLKVQDDNQRIEMVKCIKR
ncbi:MAG: hypothetical protein IJ280_04250 [Bacteroidales bacterium]|nr:hypothetical protein [Bacteroidales bacterium]